MADGCNLFTPISINLPKIQNYRIIVEARGIDSFIPALGKTQQNFDAVAFAINALENLGIANIVIDLGTL